MPDLSLTRQIEIGEGTGMESAAVAHAGWIIGAGHRNGTGNPGGDAVLARIGGTEQIQTGARSCCGAAFPFEIHAGMKTFSCPQDDWSRRCVRQPVVQSGSRQCVFRGGMRMFVAVGETPLHGRSIATFSAA